MKFFKFGKQKEEPIQKRRSSTINLGVVSTENPSGIYGLYDTEFANPKPESFRHWLESVRKGLNFFASLLFEHVRRRDLYIKSVCQTRKLPIAYKEYAIEADNEEDRKFVESNFKIKWFIQFLIDCAEANISGLSIFEINWAVEGDKVVIDKVKLIPNHLVVYDDRIDQYRFIDITKADAFKIRGLGYTAYEDRVDFSQLPLIELADEKKLEVHSLDGAAGNGFLNGYVDGLLWSYMKRNYSGKDWAIFLERFANPPVSLEYDPLTDEEGRAKAEAAVKKFGISKWTVYPSGMKFDVHDSAQKGATSQLFKDYSQEQKDEIAIAVLGQTLTTNIGDKGSYGAASIHEKVRQDLQQADMIIVTIAVNMLIEKLCFLNGIDTPPVFKFKTLIDIKFKKDLAAVVRDLRIAGYKPAAEELSKIFDLTLEEVNAVGAAADFEPGADPDEDTEDTEDLTADEKNKKDENFKRLVNAVTQFAYQYKKKETDKRMNEYLEKILNDSTK